MYHYFDGDHALKYGLIPAIVLDKFTGLIRNNKYRNLNFHDGRTWTYNSVARWRDFYLPFLTQSQIRDALDILRIEGVLITGNYGNRFNRTLWYAFADESKFLGDAKSEHLEPEPDRFEPQHKCGEESGVPFEPQHKWTKPTAQMELSHGTNDLINGSKQPTKPKDPSIQLASQAVAQNQPIPKVESDPQETPNSGDPILDEKIGSLLEASKRRNGESKSLKDDHSESGNSTDPKPPTCEAPLSRPKIQFKRPIKPVTPSFKRPRSDNKPTEGENTPTTPSMFTLLTAAYSEAFLEAAGSKYVHAGARDGKAVREFLEKCPDIKLDVFKDVVKQAIFCDKKPFLQQQASCLHSTLANWNVLKVQFGRELHIREDGQW
jgi:hypothetical protein